MLRGARTSRRALGAVLLAGVPLALAACAALAGLGDQPSAEADGAAVGPGDGAVEAGDAGGGDGDAGFDGAKARVVELAAGVASSCARYDDGRVKCWGSNDTKELGVDSVSHLCGTPPVYPCRWEPGFVPGIDDAIGIGVGALFACAARASGGVVCWGANGTGELGHPASLDGTCTTIFGASIPCNPSPIAVGGLPGADAGRLQLSVGAHHACVATPERTVYCWGSNAAGQLGDGTFDAPDGAVPVLAGASGYIEVAAAGGGESAGTLEHTCATTAAGIECWGQNYVGALGRATDGGNGDSPVPDLVHDDAGKAVNASELTAGDSVTCGLEPGGAVLCWGSNKYGAMGQGSTAYAETPMGTVPGIPPARKVSGNSAAMCALAQDGGVWCWGETGFGERGDGTLRHDGGCGTVNCQPEPGLVPGFDAVDLSTFVFHVLALRADGSVWGWGNNGNGGLGHEPGVDGGDDPSCGPCAPHPVRIDGL